MILVTLPNSEPVRNKESGRQHISFVTVGSTGEAMVQRGDSCGLADTKPQHLLVPVSESWGSLHNHSSSPQEGLPPTTYSPKLRMVSAEVCFQRGRDSVTGSHLFVSSNQPIDPFTQEWQFSNTYSFPGNRSWRE